jgi:hypothetical protein
MMRSVALIGDNPLSGAFELQIGADQIPRMPLWQSALESVPELGEIRYKPLQARSIVQIQFYARFLTLVLSLAGFACLAWCAWAARGRAHGTALGAPWTGAAWCLAGGLGGSVSALALSAPAALADLIRAWPAALVQLALACACAAAGWAVAGDSGAPRRGHARRGGEDAHEPPPEDPRQESHGRRMSYP